MQFTIALLLIFFYNGAMCMNYEQVSRGGQEQNYEILDSYKLQYAGHIQNVLDDINEHLPLARVANAIYIQNRLAKKLISFENVVESLWNFDGKKMNRLTKIPENIGPLLVPIENFARVSRSRENVTDDIMMKTIGKLNQMSDDYDVIKKASSFDKPPIFFTDEEFWKALSGKSIENCIENMKVLEHPVTDSMDLDNVIISLNTVWGDTKTLEKNLIKKFLELSANEKGMRTFMDGLSKLLEHYQEENSLKMFEKKLKETRTLVDSFAGVGNLSNIELSDQLMHLRYFFKAIQSNTTSRSTTCVAFQDNRNLKVLYEDLEAKGWLDVTVNGGRGMDLLKQELAPFFSLANALEKMENSLKTSRLRSKDFLETASPLRKFLELGQNFDSVVTGVSEILRMDECLVKPKVDVPKEASEIKNFVETIKTLEPTLQLIQTKIDEILVIPKGRGILDSFASYLKSLELPSADRRRRERRASVRTSSSAPVPTKPTDPAFDIDASKVKKANDVLAKISVPWKELTDILAKEQRLLDIPKFNLVSKIKIVTGWMKNHVFLDSKKCSFKSFDANSFNELEEFRITTDRLRSVTSSLPYSMDGLKTFNTQLSSLSSLNMTTVKSSVVVDEQSRKRRAAGNEDPFGESEDALLTVAIGTTRAVQIRKAAEMEGQLNKIAKDRRIVEAEMQALIADRTLQNEVLEHFLKAHSQFETDLPSFLENVKKAKDLTSLVIGFNTGQDALPKYYGNLSTVFSYDAPPTSCIEMIDIVAELPEGPANTKMHEFRKALRQSEAVLTVDFSSARKTFGDMTGALLEVRKAFDKFFGNASKDAEKLSTEADSRMIKIILMAVGAVVALAALITALVFLIRWMRHKCDDRRTKREIANLPPEPDFEMEHSSKLWKYNYVMLQDSRLEMNQRDPETNLTPLQAAVRRKDWSEVDELLEKGALVDAGGGDVYKTPLRDCVDMGDQEHAKWLLEKGAWILQMDLKGESPDTWRPICGFGNLFDRFDSVKGWQAKRLIPPDTPRPFKILVIHQNKKKYTRKFRWSIPLRIRHKITWKYDPQKHILDDFTHIVMPPSVVKNDKQKKTLLLDNDNMLTWKCLAALGVLMNPDWLDAVIRNPRLIDEDTGFMLDHTFYDGKETEDAVLKLKTDPHMGRPRFLKLVTVTILETNDPVEAAKKKDWEEIVRMLDGNVDPVPKPDDPNGKGPFNTLYNDYGPGHQNNTWILKYEDSKIDPVWRSDIEMYSLVSFRFLPTCIARYNILKTSNDEIPHDYIRKGQQLAVQQQENTKEAAKAKSKEGEKAKNSKEAEKMKKSKEAGKATKSKEAEKVKKSKEAGKATKSKEAEKVKKSKEAGTAKKSKEAGKAAKSKETGKAAKSKETGKAAKSKETGKAAKSKETGKAAKSKEGQKGNK